MKLVDQFTLLCSRLISADLLLLGARVALGSLFWFSARTKVEGWFTIRDATYFLFEHEYALPIIPFEWATVLATTAEHVLGITLILGLASRLSALGLLGMVAVIQFLVYPSAWPTHLSWAVLALMVVAGGGGRWSLDSLTAAGRRHSQVA